MRSARAMFPCLVSLCLFMLAIPPAPAQREAPPHFEQLDRSIVSVHVTRPPKSEDDGVNYASDAKGTGIIISELDGVVRIVTAQHEVHLASTIDVTFSFDQLKPVAAKLLPQSNLTLDAAVLEARLPPGNGAGSLPLTWQPRTALQIAGPTWSVNGSWEPVPGSIVSLSVDGDINRFTYSAEAGQGYSGGPVLNGAGQLLGMHLETKPGASRELRAGTKIDAVIEWLSSIGYGGEALNRLQKTTELNASAVGMNRSQLVANLRPLSAGDRGTLLFRVHRYQEALPLLTQASLAGDSHAATILGGMYVAGEGVAVDTRQADRWWLVGAKGGEPVAMTALGADYVGNRDYLEGENWYRKAADLGNVDAMTGIGLLFSNGQITPDGRAVWPRPQMTLAGDQQAVYWYRRASQAGSLLAKTMLGILYANGRGGLPRDYIQAVRLYRAAADAGDASGMECLAQMYVIGRGGLPQDRNQALLWYQRAAALGDKFAIEKLRSFLRN